jgi:serine/threonine protein kinase
VDPTSDATAADARGVLLDGRYRLDQVRDERSLADDRNVVLWRAVDSSLDRHVAVLVVTGRTQKIRKQLTDAATRASRVSDGRWVRVLDVGDMPVGPATATWVATEWVDGPSLTALLRHEPLRPGVATELVRQCAEALAVAARDGCRHGRLNPDEVLLPGAGLPRITGLEIAAELDPRPVEAGVGSTESEDVRGLGALLFASLTGRWPLPGWTGLPAADGKAGGLHPRAHAPGVSRDLDHVTAKALSGDYADAAAVAGALALLPAEPLDAPPPVAAPGRRLAVSTWAWRVVPPLLVLAIGIGGWEVGSALGRVPLSARAHHATLPPASATAPGTGRLTLVWTQPPAVTSFDPEGDGQENPDAVGLAVDRDPSTSWTTATYRGSPHFGGLKTGVGLLLDLGRPTRVRVAELALTAAGASVELRAGDVAPRQASDLPLVSNTDRAGAQVRWTLPAPVTARYWLVWFTSLPKAGSGYRIGISEVALLG